MRRFIRLAVGAGAIMGLSMLAAPVVAGADTPGPSFFGGADHVVFVQTDNTAGNQVVAYDRSDNGSLTLAGAYNTNGLGGQLTGSVVDHLASQGSLTYDQRSATLHAVNAGSNTVSVFSVRGDHLTLRQVVNSGGTVTPIDTVGTGQGATCWVAQAQGFFYASNAMSGSVSQYSDSVGGALTLTGQTATDPGTVDASPSFGGQYLYVQTGGNGIVDDFRVGATGSLAEIGSVTVPGAVGGEGIVAF